MKIIVCVSPGCGKFSKCIFFLSAVSVCLQHNPHEDHGPHRACEATARRHGKPVQMPHERQDRHTKDCLQRHRGGLFGVLTASLWRFTATRIHLDSYLNHLWMRIWGFKVQNVVIFVPGASQSVFLRPEQEAGWRLSGPQQEEALWWRQARARRAASSGAAGSSPAVIQIRISRREWMEK